jgi:hypothetical protein
VYKPPRRVPEFVREIESGLVCPGTEKMTLESASIVPVLVMT